MPQELSDTAKNAALNALTLDRIRLHSGDPGASGTSNALGSLTAATFASASGGSRALASNVTLTGLGASQSCTWFSVWNNNGGSPIFMARSPIEAGDTVANASGELILTTATAVNITDPA